MRLSRVELVFVAAGGALGALVGLAVLSGWLAGVAASFPPFVIVLLGLAVIEIVAGFATGRPPGALVAMPARIAAFALGLGVLVLTAGKLA
jgi:hypothetical protein